MNTVRFVKSFSNGQITIPKEFRDTFGIAKEFWLKLSLENGRIIAEPVEKVRSKTTYTQKLLTIKGDWFSAKEMKKNREGIERQLAERTL